MLSVISYAKTYVEACRAKVAAQLATHGIECRRVLFPHGLDANAYARSVQPAAARNTKPAAAAIALPGLKFIFPPP